MYEKMLSEYANGTNSMAIEAEKTANSWEGSTNRLSNSWTKFVDSLTNKDTIVGTINILSDLLSEITSLTSGFDNLNSTIVGGSSIGTFSALAGLVSSFFGVGKLLHCAPFCI